MFRRILIFGIKAAVSVGLFIIVFRQTEVEGFNQRLAGFDFIWLFGVLPFQVLQICLLACRWWLAASAIDCSDLRPRQLLRFTLSGLFFNQALPSTVGGDGIKMWLAWRSGLRKSHAVHSVLVDRFSGLLALFVLSLAGTPLLFSMAVAGPFKWLPLLLSLFGLAASAVLLGLGSLSERTRSGRRYRLSRLLLDFAHSCYLALLRVPSALWMLVVSVLVHMCTVIIVAMLARALGLSMTLHQAFVVVPTVLLISTIPISVAGWGVREGAFLFALAALGFAAADALGLSVLFGLSLLVAGAPGGLAWLISNADARGTGRIPLRSMADG